MNRIIINIAYAVCILFIAFAEGIINPFILWNIIPIIIGYFWLRRAMGRPPGGKTVTWPAIGYNIICAGIVLFFHISWLINLDGMKTSSSTAGIIFIFIPIYAFAGGLAGFLLGLIARNIYLRAAKR